MLKVFIVAYHSAMSRINKFSSSHASRTIPANVPAPHRANLLSETVYQLICNLSHL
jgi:hypothetical protein